MYKTGKISVVLFCLMSWATPVMSAEEQAAEEKVSQTENDFECSRDEPGTPTQAELKKVLADHLVWLDSSDMHRKATGDALRANLCNASLKGSALFDANSALDRNVIDLRFANLNGADLEGAELNEADLEGAELNGAILVRAELNGASLVLAQLNRAVLVEAKLNCLKLGTNEERCVDLSDAELNGAYLTGAKLHGAYLTAAKLNCLNRGTNDERCASLIKTELTGANLVQAELNGAYLREAKLNCLNLGTNEERCANLSEAELTGAYLGLAELNGANLTGAKLNEANLLNADLSGVYFETVFFPPIDSIADARNLFMMRFRDSPRALVSLQKAFKDAGFRRQERDVTYAIKHTERLKNLEEGVLGVIESGFSYILFEATTEWGRSSSRALLIMLTLFVTMVPVYTTAIAFGSTGRSESGIYKIEPKGRMVFSDGIPTLLQEDRVERLNRVWYAAIGYGVYFSLLSSFQLGWRELNVGAWISRLQPAELSFRARGWVRVASGFQSLICVYLLAIWALTYFGRPFE